MATRLLWRRCVQLAREQPRTQALAPTRAATWTAALEHLPPRVVSLIATKLVLLLSAGPPESWPEVVLIVQTSSPMTLAQCCLVHHLVPNALCALWHTPSAYHLHSR